MKWVGVRKRLRFLREAAVALLLSLTAIAAAAEPAPQLPAKFLEQLSAAQTPAQQDEVLHANPLPIPADQLRHALLQQAYQLMIAGDYRRAQSFNDLVFRLARAAGQGEQAAAAEVQNSYLFREEGDLAAALDSVEKALSFYEANPATNKHGLISAYQTQGLCYIAQSDFARALGCYHHALALAEERKSRDGIVSALNNIGEVYRTQGEPARALDFYAQARAALGDDNAWNMAFIFNNIGMCYDALADFPRAIENIQRARAVAEKVGARPRVETSLAVLGDLELKRGELKAADDFYQQSLRLGEQLHDLAGQARATLGAAQVALARGDMAKALAQSQTAVTLARKTGEIDQLAPALDSLGKSFEALGRGKEAQRAFEEAIAEVEKLRTRVAGGDIEREALFAQQIAPYRHLITLLVRQKQPAQALLAAEKASARVLLDATDAGRTVWESVLTPNEHRRQQELDLGLTEANRDLAHLQAAAKPDDAAIARAQEKLRQAQSAQEDFGALIESTHPQLHRLAPPAALRSLAELEPILPDKESVILRFAVGEEDSFLFVLSRPNESQAPALQVYSLGVGAQPLARLTNDYREMIARRGLTWHEPARQLYDLLLRPAAAQIDSAHALIIVPDGPLWDLPFQSLEKEPNHPLLLDHSLRYAPSLTLLARLEKAATTKPEHALLAFVNPALDSLGREKGSPTGREWQPLPEMEKQADALAKLYPPPAGEIFSGDAAREKTFKEKVGDAAVLHFATHGVLDDRAPLYSYLLLAQTDLSPNEDGRLEMRELLQLKLHARLAILCGCETARGQITAGEGEVGLSWGFLVAGCPATVVSQWQVESASSTQLMIALHRQLRAGCTQAEALRRASLEVRADPCYQHPFYWAPFVLIGADK